jgi:hypothetical protein
MEITENGASYLDGPDTHGKIPDTRRVEYLGGYLSALGRAMEDGANHSRVPLLEFAGQFRIGGRVHAVIWARVCGFPRPEKDHQGIGRVVWEAGGDREPEVGNEVTS